ncbi:hypothetical protein N9Y00_10100, partial [Tateyamaria sp.]|nr:hypothetical protein [Tateyamaria sp.]
TRSTDYRRGKLRAGMTLTWLERFAQTPANPVLRDWHQQTTQTMSRHNKERFAEEDREIALLDRQNFHL